MTWLWVALGGAGGATARYAVYVLLPRMPLATLTVNLVGSFLLGLAWQYLATRYPGWWQSSGALLVGTGFCGAFTTMSALALETRQMADSSGPVMAASFSLSTLALSVAALYLGSAAGKALL